MSRVSAPGARQVEAIDTDGAASVAIAAMRRRFGVSILAVERFLAEQDCSFGPRFAALMARLRALDPAAFAAIAEWPAAIGWAAGLFDRVLDYGRQRDAEAAQRCAEHIRLGETLLFAAALEGGGDLDLTPPLDLPLPFHIPGSALFADGAGVASGTIRVERVSAAGLHLAGGSVLRRGQGLKEAPCVPLGPDRSLVLSPAAMAPPWPGSPFALGALGFQSGADSGFQADHAGLLGRALDLCRRYVPDQFARLAAVMRVAAFKPLVPGTTLNASYSEFPGACVLAVIDDPHETAALLIHEAHHSLLSAYEAEGALLPEAQGDETAAIRVYSPWRADMRPPRGLLHALYVFEPVCDFWLAVLDELAADGAVADGTVGDGPLAALARDQLVRSLVQRWTGMASFRRAGRPTARGEALCALLEAGIERHTAMAAARRLTAAAPALEIGSDGTIREVAASPDGSPLSLRDALFVHATRHDRSDFAIPWMAARPWLFSGFDRP